MRKKLLHDISANSLQAIISQLSGLVIFYILSTWLDKYSFGEINWSLAVLLTTFGILSFGIDQVAIKKIALGKDIQATLSAYIGHVFISGSLLYALLFIGKLIFPAFFFQHQLLLLIGIGKLMIFFASPFKQLATGLEQFRPLMYMSICSNLVRSVALLVVAFTGQVSIDAIIIIFIAGDLAELLLCLLITKYKLKVSVLLQWNKENYRALIKESLPQLGTVIFTSGIARLDWILLGILTSNIVLANYSFAYKVFEVATTPLLIIAPILIPRFTKIFNGDYIAENKVAALFTVLRLEIIIASLVALLLNILWIPIIDLITHNKYGAVNSCTILILSASMPFLYFNNFLWTISFVQGHLKKIFYIFLACFVVNLAATVLLIPVLGAEGAAAGYLFSIIVQSLLLYMQSSLVNLKNTAPLLLSPVLAFAAGLSGHLLFSNIWLILFSSLAFFLILLLLTRQIGRSHWNLCKQIFGF